MRRRSGSGVDRKPGAPLQQRRPDPAGGVGRAHQQEFALGREPPRQLRDLTVDTVPDPLGVALDADPPLDLELTLVKRAHQKKPQDGAPATGAASPAAPVGL